MKKKKNIIAGMIALGVLATFIIPGAALAQVGSNRVQLQRHDLSVPGREVLQVVVTIGVGETFPKHKHPGEEIIYVLEGCLEYFIEGRDPVTVKAGEVVFVPAKTVHSVKNVGNSDGKELATYVVEKGSRLSHWSSNI
jgi:quercetin dioxygenase-like cupin family protein